jgi:hypothetical protein
MGRGVHEVHLTLQQSDPVVQLRLNRESLIRGYITSLDEGRVMRGNFSDVSIFPLAEFRVVVAWCGVRGLDRRRR